MAQCRHQDRQSNTRPSALFDIGKDGLVSHSGFGDQRDGRNLEVTSDYVDGLGTVKHVRLLPSVERTIKSNFLVSEVGRLKNVGDLATLIQLRLP